jgi:hypothetical protein
MEKRIIKKGQYYFPQFKILIFWRFYSRDWNAGFFERNFGKGRGNKNQLIESFYYLYMAEDFIENKIREEDKNIKNKNHNWCMTYDKLYRDCWNDNKIISEFM